MFDWLVAVVFGVALGSALFLCLLPVASSCNPLFCFPVFACLLFYFSSGGFRYGSLPALS